MGKSVLGIRIHTQSNLTDTDIGLFDGVFWLSESATSSANPWKPGLIPDNTLGDTDESIDLRPGGNVAQSGGFSVNVANATNIVRVLDTAGIVLTNKRGELIEINPDTLVERIAAVGVCTDQTWMETNLVLTFGDVGDMTNACLSPVLTDSDYPDIAEDVKGKVAPMTVGRVDKAKAIKLINKETAILNYEITNGHNWIPDGETIFPVQRPDTGKATLTYVIRLGMWTSGGSGGTLPGSWFQRNMVVGKYLKSVKGQSEGKYRKIEDAYFGGTSPFTLTVKINNAFPDALQGNNDFTSDKQTWVSIVDIDKTYVVESSSCVGFEDSGGAITITNPDLYAFSDESRVLNESQKSVGAEQFDFRQIPNFIASDQSSTHSQLIFDLNLFCDNLDTISSAIIMTPESCLAIGDDNAEASYYGDKTLKMWDHDHTGSLENYHKNNVGLYNKSGAYLGAHTLEVFQGGNIAANAIDKLANTYAQIRLASAENSNYKSHLILGFLIKPPAISGSFSFDACYFLLHGMAYSTFKNSQMNSTINYRSWIGRATEILSALGDRNSVGGVSHTIDMFDEYYGGANKGLFYYANCDSSGSARIRQVHGYRNFPLTGINTIEQFKKVLEVCILYRFKFDEWTVADELYTRLSEVAFSFVKNISIKDEIYLPFQGRTFGGTWNGRKTATALITNPVDWLEYMCRHENTSYIKNRRLAWGIDATPDEQVNVSAMEGGFDWAYLAEVKAQTIAFQRFTADDCMTRKLEQLLCAEFFLARYRDCRGRECITYVGDPIGVSNVTRHITLADVPNGMSIGVVEECPATDVVSGSMTLRYKQNYGDDSFSGIITISHIYEYAYNESYVTGYSGGLKQSLWETAHSIWVRFGNSQSKSDSTIDLLTVRDEATAVWHLEKYLANQARRRIELPVYYDKARKWTICERVTLQLPHQTNNVQIECIIEKKQEIRTRGITVLGLMLFSEPGAPWPSFSNSSVSDYSDSGSSSSMSGTSGSKSVSSASASSDSGSSNSSNSSSESSDSSTIGIATDHVHISLWNPRITTEIVKTNNNDFFGNGELDPKRKMHIVHTDAVVNDIAWALRLDHQISVGNPDVGFGTGIEIRSRKSNMISDSYLIGNIKWYYDVYSTETACDISIRSVGSEKWMIRLNTAGLQIATIQAESTDTDRFLVSNSNLVKYRTGAQVLSDIGAIGGSGTLNRLVKFTPDGAHGGDSSISDDGTTVKTALALGVGASSTPTTAGVIRCDTGLGVGIDPTSGVIGYFKKDREGYSALWLENRTNHEDAYATVGAESNACSIEIKSQSTLNGGYCLLRSTNVNGLIIKNISNTPLYLQTNDTTRLTIPAAGGLGVGIVSTDVFVHVYESNNSHSGETANNCTFLVQNAGTGDAGIQIEAGDNTKRYGLYIDRTGGEVNNSLTLTEVGGDVILAHSVGKLLFNPANGDMDVEIQDNGTGGKLCVFDCGSGVQYFPDNRKSAYGNSAAAPDGTIYSDGTDLIVATDTTASNSVRIRSHCSGGVYLETGTGGVHMQMAPGGGAIYVYNGGAQILGARVVDARIDDAINCGDATTDGVIDAIRDCLIAHGLCTAV